MWRLFFLFATCVAFVTCSDASEAKILNCEGNVFNSALNLGNQSVASGALLDDQRMTLGFSVSIPNFKADTPIARLYSYTAGTNYAEQGAAFLKDDKDIAKDVELTYKKTERINFSTHVAASPSYLLVGMHDLPLQKKKKSGVAYFYRITDGNGLEFLRSFNTTPKTDREVGKFVAVSENYAAVSRKDNRIQTFVMFAGEWRELQLIKTDFEMTSTVNIEIQGHNMNVYYKDGNNLTLRQYYLDGEWKGDMSVTFRDFTNGTLFTVSSRYQDMIVTFRDDSTDENIQMFYSNFTGMQSGTQILDNSANTTVLSVLFGATYIQQLTVKCSNDSCMVTKTAYPLNEDTLAKGLHETLYVFDAFYDTEGARHFRSYNFINHLNSKVSHQHFQIQHYRQYYFRTTIFCRYLSPNPPLASELPGLYGDTFVYAAFKSYEQEGRLSVEYFDHHDEGDKKNAFYLGFAAVALGGPFVMIAFFYSLLGYCFPGLHVKNSPQRNQRNVEPNNMMPPQA